jgi:hypothetical protein
MAREYRILLTLLTLGNLDCGASHGACTTEAVPGIVVTISDSVTGTPTAEIASGAVRDGAYEDELRPFVYEGHNMLSRAAAYERPGRYTVEITAPGYLPWRADNVRVDAGECHVATANLSAKLQLAP